MNLKKIWLIAKREYLFNFRRRSFLFAAFGIPLFTIIITGVVIAVAANTENDISGYHHIGIVDQAGLFVDSTGKALVDVQPPFEIVASAASADAALKAKKLDGYYVVPTDFFHSGSVDAYNRPDLTLSDGLQSRLLDLINVAVATNVTTQLNNPALLNRLENPFQNLSVYKIGTKQKVDESALLASFLVPMILALVIFMTTTTTSQFMMSGLAEEKENRMMELFITSVRPSEILWGKFIGLGALGLTQMLIWSVIGLVFSIARGSLNIGQTLANLQITPGYLLLLFVYFILGYLSLGAIMFGIGASVNAEQESRQIGGIITLISVLPFMLVVSYISDPNGIVPVFLSMFPLTAPTGMILRISWGTVAPSEIALSLAILCVSILVFVWLAARIFRIGLLSYGKRLSVREIFRSFREGQQAVIRPNKEAI